MKLLLQYVKSASVRVDDQIVGQIQRGLVVYLGFEKGDTESSVHTSIDKMLHLRLIPDESGKLNLSVLDTGDDLLLISQSTLGAQASKGSRLSFDQIASYENAESLYSHAVNKASASGLKVATGKFGAHMEIEQSNQGPVTIVYQTVS